MNVVGIGMNVRVYVCMYVGPYIYAGLSILACIHVCMYVWMYVSM